MATTLDVIRTLTMRAKAEGFTQAESAVSSLGTKYETSARKQLSMEKSLESLERRFVSGAKQSQEFAKVQQQLNMISAQFPQSQDRVNSVLAGATQQFKTAGTQMDKFGTATKGSRYELLNLSRQLTDVGVGIQSGQGAFTILVQQGSQIADIFATASASGRSFGATILSVITPTRILAVSIAGLAVAGGVLLKSLIDIEVQLLDLSERFDVPIQKIRAMQSVASGRGIDLSEFKAGMEGFATNVDRARVGLGDLAELFRRNGKASGDVEKSLINVADLVQRAASGQAKYRVLQEAGLPATGEWVRLLQVGGKALKAQIDDAQAESTRTADMAIQARAFNEAWSKAWDNFKRNARDAAESAAGWLSGLIAQAGQFVQAAQVKVLGARGFTPEQALRKLGQDTLASGIGTKLTADEAGRFYNNMRGAGEVVKDIKGNTTKLNSDAREGNALAAQRLQILGNLASLEEVVAQKVKDINEARAKGVQLSAQEVAQLTKIAELTEVARRSSGRVSALSESATVLDKYGAKVDELKVKLADTTITQKDFNREVALLNPVVQGLTTAISEVGAAMAAAFIQGKDAAEALHASLKAVASTAASATINNLIKGDLAGAAISAAVAGTAFLADKIFGGPTAEDKKRAEEAISAMNQADSALKSVTESFMALTAAAEGAVTSTLKNAKQQFEQLKNAAESSRAAALIIVNTPGNTPAVMAQANANIAAANQAVLDATQQLADFNLRTINEALDNFVSTDLSPIAQGLKDLHDKAKDLTEALILTGRSAEEAAQLVGERLTKSLTMLANKINADLDRKIYEAGGRGWINQLSDLKAEISDLALGGGDASKIADYVKLTVQNIVDSNKIVGNAFADLQAQFPDLTDGVREFSEAAVAAAEAVDNAAEIAAKAAEDAAARLASLEDRFFAASNRGDDLGTQLASFDREANKQRTAEQAAGNQNIAKLEEVLALERQNIIDDFNAAALKQEQDAAAELLQAQRDANQKIAEEQLDLLESQIKAEKERVETIKKANQDIIDYLNGLLTSSLSPLSAKAQLDAARQLYEAQLALAQSGDLTALQNITHSADTLLNASKAFYGSSLGYQRDFQNVQGQLGDLAAMPASVGVPGVANDNVAAISAAGFADVKALLQRLVDIGEENNVVIPLAINGQTILLTQEERFNLRKAGVVS